MQIGLRDTFRRLQGMKSTHDVHTSNTSILGGNYLRRSSISDNCSSKSYLSSYFSSLAQPIQQGYERGEQFRITEKMHHLKDKLQALAHLHDDNGQNQAPIQYPSQQSARIEYPSQQSTPIQYPYQQSITPQTVNTNIQKPTPAHPELLHTTQLAITVFLASLNPGTGEIGGIGHWQTANGFTAILLHDLYSQNPDPKNVRIVKDAVAKTLNRCPGCVNEFNDDTIWWGICMLELRELCYGDSSEGGRRGGDEWINAALRIQHHVSAFVIPPHTYKIGGKDMYGAVMWTSKPSEQQVNTITTGLYAELCARLALLLLPSSPARATELLRAAELSLNWIVRCRYRDSEALVLDTIFLRTGESRDWTFTYTTGQAILACVALCAAPQGTGGSRTADEYLGLACTMARQSLQRPGWVEANGVLTEHGAYGKGNHEPWKNDDAVGFKSVLVRALVKLYRLLTALGRERALAEEIGRFIETQFQSLQERNGYGNGQYGPWWNGPLELATSHAQLAVLDVMAGVHAVRG